MDKIIPSARRGQSLVEFALIIPIFLLLMVVIFDLGRAVYYYSAIHNAAREGARYGAAKPLQVSGSITADKSGMKAAAVNYAIGLGLNTNDVDAGLGTPECIGNLPYPTPPTSPCHRGIPNPTVKVTVTYCFVPATPLVDMFLPKCPTCTCTHLRLLGEAVMRTEWMPSTP
jgi:hypothetical protein